MSHPFNIDDFEIESLDLDFEEQLTEEEAENVGGGLTIAPGEPYPSPYPHYPGPWNYPLPKPFPRPYPYPLPYPKPEPQPPIYTTLAIGEEGGGPGIW